MIEKCYLVRAIFVEVVLEKHPRNRPTNQVIDIRMLNQATSIHAPIAHPTTPDNERIIASTKEKAFRVDRIDISKVST